MLKRQPVVGRQEVIFSPIQNSIETIQKRNAELMHELKTYPPQIKNLQNVLQGSVLLQVNAGALEICKEFLGNAGKYQKATVHILTVSVQEFLGYCKDAIALNKTLIGADQAFFHSQLEAGYKELHQEITKCIFYFSTSTVTQLYVDMALNANWDNYKEEQLDHVLEEAKQDDKKSPRDKSPREKERSQSTKELKRRDSKADKSREKDKKEKKEKKEDGAPNGHHSDQSITSRDINVHKAPVQPEKKDEFSRNMTEIEILREMSMKSAPDQDTFAVPLVPMMTPRTAEALQSLPPVASLPPPPSLETPEEVVIPSMPPPPAPVHVEEEPAQSSASQEKDARQQEKLQALREKMQKTSTLRKANN